MHRHDVLRTSLIATRGRLERLAAGEVHSGSIKVLIER
jgi:hypothetical protein